METRAPGLGEYLISQGLITQLQLDDALNEQKQTRERLGEILIHHELITDQDLLGALGHQFGVRLFDPNQDEVQTEALGLIPLEFADQHDLLPITLDETFFTVAMADPLDFVATDQLQRNALKERATDIHIEPQEKGLVTRYRVDGLLYDALTPPRAVFSGMVRVAKCPDGRPLVNFRPGE